MAMKFPRFIKWHAYFFQNFYWSDIFFHSPSKNYLYRKFIETQERGDDKVILWGDGSPTREFLYAGDAAEAILLAAEKYNDSEPINLGSGMEISIRDLAQLIARLTGYEGEFVWDTSKPNGQPRRALDVKRAEANFGFRAQMPFEEGLQQTIDWYRETLPA